MKNAYQARDAASFVREHPDIPEALALRIYTSRLLGGEPSLVLHGGGNTSVKVRGADLLGEDLEILYIKGAGSDLAGIGATGFTALDLAALRRLRALRALDDEEMENQLLIGRLHSNAPPPSVETLLHAFLPHRFIDHTHADALLILGNRDAGGDRLRDALGGKVAVLPYLMPGLRLAHQVADCWDANPGIEAIVSLNHGVFTFGEDAETAYGRMIEVVTRAEAIIEARTGRRVYQGARGTVTPSPGGRAHASMCARAVQTLRGACATPDGSGRSHRLVAELRCDPELVEISESGAASEFCASGVLTPDHVIRAKNEILHVGGVPESDDELRGPVASEIERYCARYDEYFRSRSSALNLQPRKLDPYPRLALVKGVGLVGLGKTRQAARAAADIGTHQLRAKLITEDLGGHVPIGLDHVFEMEYWRLQQNKLRGRSSPVLEGQIALVTGAGGAIGAGIADRLLEAGAVVAITDIDRARLEAVKELLGERHDPANIETLCCDVSSFEAVAQACEELSLRLGGLDILVPNAGIAQVATLEELDPKRFDQVISVNLVGVFNTIKAAIPIFRRQGSGGNVVLISSKNVPDPGAAFGAYSASKAGAHQIGKIAALELAGLGVRVNMVNPDAVFGDERVSSGLWDLIGPDRMRSRGLDPEGLRNYYRDRNLLKAQVLSEHVGNAVVFFASEQTPTTGASFPVDGGVPSAFPR